MGDYIEVLALDGTVLFANASGVLPDDGPATVGLWLHYGDEAAELVLDAARVGEAGTFAAALATEDGVLRHWEVVVTPLRTATGEVDALLVTSHPVRPRDDAATMRDTMERLELALSAGPVIGHVGVGMCRATGYSPIRGWRRPFSRADGAGGGRAAARGLHHEYPSG